MKSNIFGTKILLLKVIQIQIYRITSKICWLKVIYEPISYENVIPIFFTSYKDGFAKSDGTRNWNSDKLTAIKINVYNQPLCHHTKPENQLLVALAPTMCDNHALIGGFK